MKEFFDFVLLLISQFAGGTGQMENNLVRFSIPAVTYGALLLVAWSRQRESHPPRERLLVWGFGLGAASAIVMSIFVAIQMLGIVERETAYPILVPLERSLSIASIVVVAGAFLRYILDDARLARTYIGVGVGVTFINLIIALWQWPLHLALLTESLFHQSWVSWLFQLSSSVLIITAIILVRRNTGWLSNVVTIALVFFLMGELFFLANYLTDRVYRLILCPIGNFFPILAIPILGYVYLREMSIERRQAQKDLENHRLHLEELVTDRTAELSKVNTRLQGEVTERKKAEEALSQLSHEYELILESAGEGICGIDRQGRFVFVNSAAAKILGYAVDELVGKPCHVIWQSPGTFEKLQPEDKHPIQEGYSQGIPSRRDDLYFLRKNGLSFPVAFVCNPTYENGKLNGLVVVFRDITRRKKAEAEIAQRNANLAAQNTIASTLSRSLDLRTILDTSLDAVLSIVNMEAGLVFLWDSVLDKLTLRSYRGSLFREDSMDTVQEWGCCDMISTEAMRNFSATVKPVSECPAAHASPMIAREDLKILVSVPLVSSGKALGALTLASRKTDPIPPHELELLTIVGQQIGMAVENANLYQAAERVAGELTLLHQISTVLASTLNAENIYEQIVTQSVKLLDCPTVCILDWDDAGQKARLLAGHGITEAEGDLLQTQMDAFECLRDLVACRNSIAVSDARTDSRIPASWLQRLGLRALLCVPIRSMDESFGALFLMDRQAERNWRYEEIVLIEAFVNRAAVALMNANLHKQLEWAAALEERQRIAADMHDGLGQTVSLLGLQIDNAMEFIKTGSEQQAVEELSTTRETVKQVSVEVRRSIASLQRTPQPLRSLQELLAGLPEKLSWVDNPPVHFKFGSQIPLFLPQEQADQVLFVVQEALLNAHRHAHARQITIAFEPQERGSCITVEDDGLGFEQGAWWETSQSHFGLGVMHSRAARIGADLRIDSSPGHGTRVTLTLPGRGNDRSPLAVDTGSLTPQNTIKQGMTQ